MELKQELRAIFRKRRLLFSKERRAEAERALLKTLWPLCARLGPIRSFSSMLGEIDLTLFNERLFQENRLVLPEERELPVDLILVPALAFDRKQYRLGYGQGYYDRLLAEVPKVPAWGIGFREEMSEELLPRDPWDLPVQKVLLF